MARRTLVDIDDRLLDAVMDIGAHEGIQGITTVKVAKMCGVSHFTCFDHFGTKQNLLDQAAAKFEIDYLKIIMKHLPDAKSVGELWLMVLDDLMKNSNGAIYYLNYFLTFGYVIFPQNANPDVAKIALVKHFGELKDFTDETYALVWDHFTNQCIVYAAYFAKRPMVDTPENRKLFKDLVFKGIDKLVGRPTGLNPQ